MTSIGFHRTRFSRKPLVTEMLRFLGLSEDQAGELKTIPYEDLCKAYEAAAPKMREQGLYVGQTPFINDWFLGRLENEGVSEHAKTIPLMIGTVFGEFAFLPPAYNKYELTDEEVDAKLAEKYGEYKDQIADLYKKAYPDKMLIDALVLDGMFRRPTKAIIAAKSRFTESPTYSYLFAFEFPVQNGKLAWHCSDIPFFFHNIDLVASANVLL